MSALDDLPPLRDVIKRHGLSARKSLGQNFILDLNLTAKIARAAGSLDDHTIIEVGPGPGGLTRALLANGARHVIAIEKDSRAIAALSEISGYYPGRLTIIEADALECDMAALTQGQPTRIVANLPYNIGTRLLVQWLTLDEWPPWWDSLTLMFQREVAERIAAHMGTDAYGRLGVLAGWRTHARIAFDVAPSAFVPPPKVRSSVVHLEPRQAPAPCPLHELETITQKAFGQRRKMLRQSLKGVFSNPVEVLEQEGIPPTLRAEEVSIAGYAALARRLHGMLKSHACDNS
jgi:16S rRNA (adenine1518-N6/adenine1519-N6)-dimethyltransferase